MASNPTIFLIAGNDSLVQFAVSKTLPSGAPDTSLDLTNWTSLQLIVRALPTDVAPVFALSTADIAPALVVDNATHCTATFAKALSSAYADRSAPAAFYYDLVGVDGAGLDHTFSRGRLYFTPAALAA